MSYKSSHKTEGPLSSSEHSEKGALYICKCGKEWQISLSNVGRKAYCKQCKNKYIIGTDPAEDRENVFHAKLQLKNDGSGENKNVSKISKDKSLPESYSSDLTALSSDYSFVEKPDVDAGAFGNIYVIKHHRTNRLYAMKVLGATRLAESRIDLFKREIEFLRDRLPLHQNLIRLYDILETEDGRPCYIMDYIKGYSLSQAMKCDELFRNTFQGDWRTALKLLVCG